MGWRMIGRLITMFFNFLLTIIMTIIQLIMLPVNLLFNAVFPDFTAQINNITTAITQVISWLAWPIDILPAPVRAVLLFIFTLELVLLVVLRSTYLIGKAWAILQKVKFW